MRDVPAVAYGHNLHFAQMNQQFNLHRNELYDIVLQNIGETHCASSEAGTTAFPLFSLFQEGDCH